MSEDHRVHGSIHLDAKECEPCVLDTTPVVTINLARGSDVILPIDVYLYGTVADLDAWLDKMRAALHPESDPALQYNVEEFPEAWGRRYSTEEALMLARVLSGRGPAPSIADLKAHGVDTEVGIVRGADCEAGAAVIRAALEPWVPAMTDEDLYTRFMDWTTDGRHDLFAAHLNTQYEPKDAE